MKKTVVITGISRGIGRACALEFAGKGWNVTGCYARAEEAAQSLRGELEELGVGCRIERADVTDAAALRRLLLLTEADFGAPEALVCCAGIAEQKLFTDITEDDWKRMLDVNAGGTYRAIQAVLPGMLAGQRGSIVTVASVWGETGGSCEAHYSASKAAVIGLTRALAKELGLSGIRVNCLSPGVIDTDMNRMHGAETMAQLAADTPLGRIGTPEEAARAAYWLASDAASFVTGQVLGVNGGFYI